MEQYEKIIKVREKAFPLLKKALYVASAEEARKVIKGDIYVYDGECQIRTPYTRVERKTLRKFVSWTLLRGKAKEFLIIPEDITYIKLFEASEGQADSDGIVKGFLEIETGIFYKTFYTPAYFSAAGNGTYTTAYNWVGKFINGKMEEIPELYNKAKEIEKASAEVVL